jgi:hypothetical protein
MRALLVALLIGISAPAMAQISFDSTAGHSAVGNLSTSASAGSITVTIVAGETAFLLWMGYSTGEGIASISGGGTWSAVHAEFFESDAYQFWSTTASGAASASSITVTLAAGNDSVNYAVGQYLNVKTLNKAGSTIAQASSTNPTITKTGVTAGNTVVSGEGSSSAGTATTSSGTIEIQQHGTHGWASLIDNTGGTSVTNGVTLTTGTWGAFAVELTPTILGPPAGTLGMMGAGL